MADLIRTNEQVETFIISPREVCQSCNHASGPKFSLSACRDTTSILRINPTLTATEIAHVEANISHAQYEEVLLDQEIHRIRQILQQLQQRRDTLRRFGELERGLLSPIRKLPMEVLQHIFILAHTDQFYSHDFKAFPRVAAQVSSYWRTVSHGCATLWKNIVCMPHISHWGLDEYIPRYGKLLEDCIHLSYGLPVSLWLDSHLTAKVLGAICVKALARCAHRWENVVIMNGELAKAIFSLIPNPKDTQMEHLKKLHLSNLKDVFYVAAAPKLQYLTFDGCDGGDPNVQIMFHSVPSLVHLSVGSIYHPSTAFSGVDWSQITQFESRPVQYRRDEFVTILESMRNLYSLTVYGSTGATRRISLPHLAILKVGGSDSEPNILDILTTPNLNDLDVGWGFDGSSVVQFVRRSDCTLEELTISVNGIDDSWMTADFSSVKTFKLIGPISIAECFQWLTVSPARYNFLPRLENLDLIEIDGPTVDDDEWNISMLIDLVKSRLGKEGSDQKMRSYLKDVDIRFEFILTDEDTKTLTDFFQSEPVRSSNIQVYVEDGSDFHLYIVTSA